MEQKKRLQYVDVIKGIAIIWVILYHLIAPSAGKMIFTQYIDIFITAFFFYSGYFYKPGKKSFAENVKAKTKALMGPFFKYSWAFWVIGSLYLVATKNETIKEAFFCLRNFYVGCIWNRVIQGWFNLEYYSLGKRYFFLADFWFLLALLFASVLFFFIADRALESVKATLLSVLALFCTTAVLVHFAISLPYNLQLVPYWTAFMLLGALAGKNKLIELPSVSTKVRWVSGIATLAIGIIIGMNRAPVTNQFRGSFGENEVLSIILCIVTAVLIIWGLSQICALAEDAGMRTKEIAWVGQNSLIFYLFHMFFAWILSLITGFSIFYEEPVSSETVLFSILLSLASFVLCALWVIPEDKVAILHTYISSASALKPKK